MFIDFGPWIEPGGAGEVDDLPGNNSSYKREALLAYGGGLAARLDVQPALHRDLRARGHRLYLEPAARVNHLNVSLPSAFLRQRFWLGRRFAAGRARHWSPSRRLLYATVGIPWILLNYAHGPLRAMGRSRMRWRLLTAGLPILLAGLAARGLGEAVGFATGSGNSIERDLDVEFNRHRQLSRRDCGLAGDL
jgi:hypothetical protein